MPLSRRGGWGVVSHFVGLFPLDGNICKRWGVHDPPPQLMWGRRPCVKVSLKHSPLIWEMGICITRLFGIDLFGVELVFDRICINHTTANSIM